LYYPARFVWNIADGKYDARTLLLILVAWGLVNLILYQIISAVVAYLWDHRNKKNFILNASGEERKLLKRRYGVTTDEELDKIEEKPSIFAALLFNSTYSLSTIRSFLVDGPHINYLSEDRARFDGIIKNQRFFEFAAIRGERLNRQFVFLMFRPRYMPFVILSGILGYLSICLPFLIPFRRAEQVHFRRVNEFVAGFSTHAAFRIRVSQPQKDWDIPRIQ
jgi:hypothetical protein